jgi:hypothetical protein
MQPDTNTTDAQEAGAPDGPKERGPELGLAAFLMLLAGLVIYDSLRVGIGWADDGPRSGYFPFYIGLMLLASSSTVFVATLVRWSRSETIFAEHSQLATVFAMLVPMVVYIVAMVWLGLYVPSALLIGYFMRRYGKFGWGTAVAVSVLVPVAFFLVFERWFLVPLPKGPLEALLGF